MDKHNEKRFEEKWDDDFVFEEKGFGSQHKPLFNDSKQESNTINLLALSDGFSEQSGSNGFNNEWSNGAGVTKYNQSSQGTSSPQNQFHTSNYEEDDINWEEQLEDGLFMDRDMTDAVINLINSGHQQSAGYEQQVDDDDEGDWDTDIMMENSLHRQSNGPEGHFGLDLKVEGDHLRDGGSQFAGMFGNNSEHPLFEVGGVSGLTSSSPRESLLEHLETVVQRTIIGPHRVGTVQRGYSPRHSAASAQPGASVLSAEGGMRSSMSSACALRAHLEGEETRALESANSHLKGLFEWIEAGAATLRTVLFDSNCSSSLNAVTLLRAEVQRPLTTDPEFLHNVLSRCELHPADDDCLSALEMVVQWLRAISGLSDCSKNSTSGSGNNNYSFGGASVSPLAAVSRCEVLLAERSRSGRHSVSLGHEVLERQLEDGASCRLSQMEVRSMFALLARHVDTLRLQTHLLEIKAHWKRRPQQCSVAQQRPCVEDLMVSLGELEGAVDELDLVLNEWLRMLYFFIPSAPASHYRGTDATASEEASSMAAQCFDSDDPRVQTVRRTLGLDSGGNAHSLCQHHCEVLLRVVVDLQALCVANKLLLLSGVSPVSLMSLLHPETESTLGASQSSAKSSTSSGLSGKKAHHFPSLLRRTKQAAEAVVAVAGKSDQTPVFVEDAPLYDVSFELVMGAQFISLMTLIPSPSIARAKLSFAAFSYLKSLWDDALPWQSSGWCTLVDASVLVPDDEDYGSLQDLPRLDAQEVATAVDESFAEAFGTMDDSRVLQLLLFEGAVDLLPSPPRDSGTETAPPSTSRHHRKSSFHKDVFHFHKDHSRTREQQHLRDCEGESGDSSRSDWDGQGAASRPCMFSHVPLSMDLGRSVLQSVLESPCEYRLHQTDETSSAQVKRVQAVAEGIAVSVSLKTEQPVPPKLFSMDASSPVPVELAVPSVKSYTLSSSLHHELCNFSFVLFSSLSARVASITSSAALGLHKLCAMLAGHLNRPAQLHSLHRDAAILAVKLERHEAAVMHGRVVLGNLLRGNGSEDLSELLYITGLVAGAFCENAQHELALRTLFSALHGINAEHSSPTTSDKLSAPAYSRSSSWSEQLSTSSTTSSVKQTYSQVEFEQAVYPLLLRMGCVLLEMGLASKAVDVLQVLLAMLLERVDCVTNDERKVVVLSWLAECFLGAGDADSCSKVVRGIKEVRKCRIEKIVTPVSNTPVSSDFDGIALIPSASSSEQQALSSQSKQPKRFFSRSPRQPPSSTRPAGGVHTSSTNVVSSEGSSNPAPAAETGGNRSASSLKYHVNSKDSSLPKHCVTTYNTDLGAVIARGYLCAKQFVAALKSLTPTIIGVELVVGHKNSRVNAHNKDGLLELGKLYYLRGKIQLEASKASEFVRYPFEVGSSQLFAAIQLISADIRKSRSASTDRKQFCSRSSGPSTDAAAAASGKVLPRSDSMQSSVGEHAGSTSFTGKGPFNSAGGTSLLTCKKAITYANPADLLWDAMKWFRRSWDLFHAAGDEVSAAKAANYIANCHLTPTFVPTAFFGTPLDKSRNLSTWTSVVSSDLPTVDARSVSLRLSPKDSSFSSALSPQKVSCSSRDTREAHRSASNRVPAAGGDHKRSDAVRAGTLRKQPSSLPIDEGERDSEGADVLRPLSVRSCGSVHFGEMKDNSDCLAGPGAVKRELVSRSASSNSALFANLRTDSSDEEPRPAVPASSAKDHTTGTGLGAKSSSSSSSNAHVHEAGESHRKGQTVLMRQASLEEVQRVMQFALEISLDSCLPLSIIESYINLAELYVLQDNHQEGLAYWWEARELFLHLYCDGALMPVLRRASLQAAQKLHAICSRLVRFLFTCDRAVVNKNLFLLDMQLQASSELSRCAKNQQVHVKRAAKPLDDLLMQLSGSTPLHASRTGASSYSIAGITPARVRSFLRKGSVDSMEDSSHMSQVAAPVAMETLFARLGFSVLLTDSEFCAAVSAGSVESKLADFSWKQYVRHDGVESHNTPGRDVAANPLNSSAETPPSNSGKSRQSLARQLSVSMGWTAAKPPPQTSDNDRDKKAVIDAVAAAWRSRRKYDAIPESLRRFLLVRGDLAVDDSAASEEPLDELDAGTATHEAASDSLGSNSSCSTEVHTSSGNSSKMLAGGMLAAANFSLVIPSNPVHCKPQHLRPDDAESTISSNCVSSSGARGKERDCVAPGQRALPLDPHWDFEWMDASYAAHYSEQLLLAAPSDAPSAELFDSSLFSVDCAAAAGQGPILTQKFFLAVEEQAECVLVQRVWRCLLAMKVAQRNYQHKRFSLDMLRHTMRSHLRNMSLFMYRLRALSRQYQGRTADYDDLVAVLGRTVEVADGKSDECASGTANSYIGAALGSDSGDCLSDSQHSRGEHHPHPPQPASRAQAARKAVSLFHRVPHAAFALHIDNLLMLYRPHDGSHHVQLFGGRGYLLYSTVTKPQPTSRPVSLTRKHPSSKSSRTKSSGIRQLTKLHSMSSFMLPFVSSSGDESPGPTARTVVAEAVSLALDRQSPLEGIVEVGRGAEGERASASREFQSSALEGERQSTRPPLTSGRFALDRSNSDSFQTKQQSKAGLSREGRDSQKKNFTSGSSLEDSLSLACSSSSSENLQVKQQTADNMPNATDSRQQMSRSWFSLSSNTILSSKPHASQSRSAALTTKADSVMSMVSILSHSSGAPSFSRISSVESLFAPGDRMQRLTSVNNLHDPASRAVSTAELGVSASAQPAEDSVDCQVEVSLTRDDVSLLFDLCVHDSGATCGGGPKLRKSHFEKMTQGVLASAVSFLRSCATSPAAEETGALPFYEPGVTPTTSTQFVQRRPAASRGNSNSMSTLSTTTESFQLGVSNMSKSSSAGTDTTHIPHHGHSSSNSGRFMSGIFTLFHPSDLSEGLSEQDSDSLCDSPSQSSAILAPLQVIPLTLICSTSLNGLPWEMLLPDCRVVRGTSLLALCTQTFSCSHVRSAASISHQTTLSRFASGQGASAEAAQGKPPLSTPKHKSRHRQSPSDSVESFVVQQKMKGFLGPGWNQNAVFVASTAADAKTVQHHSDLLWTADLTRRMRSGLQCISSLGQRSDCVTDTRQYQTLLARTLNVRGIAADIKEQSSQSIQFPLTSPLVLSTASRHSSLSLLSGSNHLDLKVVEIGACAGQSMEQYLSTFERRLALLNSSDCDHPRSVTEVSDSHFPVVLLSYTDLVEACEAVTYLSARRFDAVLVFAPHFVIESLAVEIKIALNRWCRPPASVAHRLESKRPISSGSAFLRGLKGATSFRSAEYTQVGVEEGRERGGSGSSHSSASSNQCGPPMSTAADSVGAKDGGETPSKGSPHHSRGVSLDSGSGRSVSFVKRSLSTFGSKTSNSSRANLGHGVFGASLGRVSSRGVPEWTEHSNPGGGASVGSGVCSESEATQRYSEKPNSSSRYNNQQQRHHQKRTVRAKDRTWVYHALMAVVSRAQEEHAVPIAVFI